MSPESRSRAAATLGVIIPAYNEGAINSLLLKRANVVVPEEPTGIRRHYAALPAE